MFVRLLNYSMRNRGGLHPRATISPSVSFPAPTWGNRVVTSLYLEVLKASHHHSHLCTKRKQEMGPQHSLAFPSVFALEGEFQYLLALCNSLFSQLRRFKVLADHFLVDYFCYFSMLGIYHWVALTKPVCHLTMGHFRQKSSLRPFRGPSHFLQCYLQFIVHSRFLCPKYFLLISVTCRRVIFDHLDFLSRRLLLILISHDELCLSHFPT